MKIVALWLFCNDLLVSDFDALITRSKTALEKMSSVHYMIL